MRVGGLVASGGVHTEHCTEALWRVRVTHSGCQHKFTLRGRLGCKWGRLHRALHRDTGAVEGDS